MGRALPTSGLCEGPGGLSSEGPLPPRPAAWQGPGGHCGVLALVSKVALEAAGTSDRAQDRCCRLFWRELETAVVCSCQQLRLRRMALLRLLFLGKGEK